MIGAAYINVLDKNKENEYNKEIKFIGIKFLKKLNIWITLYKNTTDNPTIVIMFIYYYYLDYFLGVYTML